MVKIVLIGKIRGGAADDAGDRSGFVGSGFILSERRGVMVNRVFRSIGCG
jgi:hypothetical protein